MSHNKAPALGDPGPARSDPAAPNPAAPYQVVIPARYGASRLPGKPLVDIGGKPLIAHVWERARQSQATAVLVATDDERILAACKEIGAEAMLTSAHHPSGTDRIGEVMRARGWAADTIVVNLQGDEPCVPPCLLDQVAAALARNPAIGMATLSAPIEEAETLKDPHVVKVVTDAEDVALYFSRAPIPWHRDAHLGARASLSAKAGFRRHIGIYAYRVRFLERFLSWAPAPLEQIEALEQLRALWHGERILVEDASAPLGPGVDTRDDIDAVLQWLATERQ